MRNQLDHGIDSRFDVRLIGVTGIPDVQAGDDLAALSLTAIQGMRLEITAGDVFVFTQKIVSKAEGRLVDLTTIAPSTLAIEWSARWGKDARVIELVLRDAVRIVRMERGIIVAETCHGFVCANAGVDTSNVSPGFAVRLPADPDATARQLCRTLRAAFGCAIGVIISDTFGRPWREGQTNVAIGLAGLHPIVDYRGSHDHFGQPLRTTAIAAADEIAAAAELVMGKARRIPLAIITGVDVVRDSPDDGAASELVRSPASDMFR